MVQTCVIHLLRNTFRYASRKYWDADRQGPAPDLHRPHRGRRAERFDEFTEKWGTQYPAIIRLWRNAWAEFVPFLDYGACCKSACRASGSSSVARMAGVARSYRPVLRDQAFLLPPDMREWLPEDHLAWLVLEIVEQLDRSALHARHPNVGAGRAAYDPDMLLALLIYAYCQGVRSSRQIQQRCVTDVAFRVLCAQDVPDHTTIARFRAEHQEVFAGCSRRCCRSPRQPGLARFGTVAIDGTKIAGERLDGRQPPPGLAGP